MDDAGLILLGLLFVVAFPVMALTALILVGTARTRIGTLERLREADVAQIAVLAARLAHAERQRASEPRPRPEPSVAAPGEAAAGQPPAAETSETTPEGTIPPAQAPIGEAATEPAGAAAVPPPLPPSAAPPIPPQTPPPGNLPPMPGGAPAPAAGPGLEESLGTRWSVWLGGLALALGAVFLVKYSIDQGYFGPLARIILAGLFSAALIVAGEFMRRREPASEASTPAPIPSVLTAAGTIAAFATVYGAYALYDLIGPGVAFVLLGVVAVGTMAVALLHGPWIVTLGMLGAYATPLLIETDQPNVAALVIYLLSVTLAAFGLARLRLWRWAASVALVLALAWGFVIVAMVGGRTALPVEAAAYLIGLLALHAGILVVSIDEPVFPPNDRPLDPLGLAGILGLAVLAFLLLQADDYGLAGRVTAALVLAASLGLAWRCPAMAPAAAIGAFLAFCSALSWAVDIPANLDNGVLVQGVDGLNRIRPKLIGEYAGIASLLVGVFVIYGGLGAIRSTPGADRTGGWFAGAATFTPALIVLAAWLRIDGWAPSPLFAMLALVLAVLSAALTWALGQREYIDKPALSVAVAAIGTVATLGLALTIALERGALTIALALVVPAIAWVHGARRIAILKPLAALFGVMVLARVAWEPRIVGSDLGTTPIFNWLLYGYGVPALGFGYAAHAFRRRQAKEAENDAAIAIIEALAVIFTGLLMVLEIRHLVHGGDVYARGSSLMEMGLMISVGLIFSAALSRLAGRLGSPIYDGASLVIASASLFVCLVGLLFGFNPAFSGEDVGENIFFNDLLLGYLVPALAAGAAALASRRSRPRAYVVALGLTALALGFVYASLMVRHWYHGGDLTAFRLIEFSSQHRTGDAEFWTYSVVWLLYGVATLIAGGLMRSPAVRLASAAIIALTVVKVFLLDMSALTGIFRALSFIGLGFSLIAIGWLYQKLLMIKPQPLAPEPGEPGPPEAGPPAPSPEAAPSINRP
ncbi:MAG: DUF2339 domain-containing protein [Ancalomicrobiaceae bacterium]|nr:DUF2339 domain-containing protein [Ancalomicrobiaceae bacterium]